MKLRQQTTNAITQGNKYQISDVFVNLVGVEESATVTPGRTKIVTGGDSKT